MFEDEKQPITSDTDDSTDDEDLDLDDNDIEDEGDEGEADTESDDTDDENELPEESDDDDVEALKEKIKQANKIAKTALAQKKKWREKAQAGVQSKDDNSKAEAPKKGDDAKSKSTDSINEQEVINFRFDHPHLATKHVKEILKFARANDLSLEQSMKSPTIKIYVAQARKKDEMVDAAPGSNKRGKESKPAKDWSTASLEEVRKHRAEILARPRG